MYDGKITDYERLSDNYWLQPEFYPGWFPSADAAYTNNDPNMWTPEGYGCYPTIKEIEVTRGSDIIVNTYFKTGYGTEAYQGLVVKAILPDTAKDLMGNDLFEQPEGADSNIHPMIKNPNDPLYESFKSNLIYNNVGENDWMVILKPTYQLLRDKYGEVIGESGFPDDWVRIVQLGILIDENTPVGDYIVALEIETPCFDINQEYYFSTEHEYYGASYYPAGQFHRTLIPHFQVVLHII